MAREKSKHIAYETEKKAINNNKDNNTSNKNNVDDDGHNDGDNKTQVDQYIRML